MRLSSLRESLRAPYQLEGQNPVFTNRRSLSVTPVTAAVLNTLVSYVIFLAGLALAGRFARELRWRATAACWQHRLAGWRRLG